LADDVACIQVDTAVGVGGPRLITPERPLASVDAADNTRGGAGGNKQLKSADGVGNSTVSVNSLAQSVHECRYCYRRPVYDRLLHVTMQSRLSLHPLKGGGGSWGQYSFVRP